MNRSASYLDKSVFFSAVIAYLFIAFMLVWVSFITSIIIPIIGGIVTAFLSGIFFSSIPRVLTRPLPFFLAMGLLALGCAAGMLGAMMFVVDLFSFTVNAFFAVAAFLMFWLGVWFVSSTRRQR